MKFLLYKLDGFDYAMLFLIIVTIADTIIGPVS